MPRRPCADIRNGCPFERVSSTQVPLVPSNPCMCRPCACPPPLHATLSITPRNRPVCAGLVPAHLPYTPPSPSPPATHRYVLALNLLRLAPKLRCTPSNLQRKCLKNSDIIVLYQYANRHYQERIFSAKPYLPLAGNLKAEGAPQDCQMPVIHLPSTQQEIVCEARPKSLERGTLPHPPGDRRESEDCQRVVVRLPNRESTPESKKLMQNRNDHTSQKKNSPDIRRHNPT